MEISANTLGLLLRFEKLRYINLIAKNTEADKDNPIAFEGLIHNYISSK